MVAQVKLLLELLLKANSVIDLLNLEKMNKALSKVKPHSSTGKYDLTRPRMLVPRPSEIASFMEA